MTAQIREKENFGKERNASGNEEPKLFDDARCSRTIILTGLWRPPAVAASEGRLRPALAC